MFAPNWVKLSLADAMSDYKDDPSKATLARVETLALEFSGYPLSGETREQYDRRMKARLLSA